MSDAEVAPSPADERISFGRGNPDHMVSNRPYPRPSLYIEVSDSEEDAKEEEGEASSIVILSEGEAETRKSRSIVLKHEEESDDVVIVNVVEALPKAEMRKRQWAAMYATYSRLVETEVACRVTLGGNAGDYGAADMERLQRIARESFAQPARRSTARISSSTCSPGGGVTTRPTPPPSAKQMEGWEEHCSAFLFLNGIEAPTAAAAEALGVPLLAGEHYLHKTEPLGVYFIKRGFPLIGKGRYSLVFLLTGTYVAKVAKYRADHKDKGYLYEEHIRERNNDVALYRDYPTTNAETRYVRVNVEEPAYATYQLYIQERLSAPFYHGGLDPDEAARDENGYMITAMVVRNRGVHEMNQWGTTRVRRHTLVRADGTQEERERRWLVRFDNE